MDNERTFCWVLVVVALLVLAVTSRLDLLAILVPTAVLLSIVVAGWGPRKSGLTGSAKKG